jgi:Zn finger protein HypA/HybF involved in hydrogenase expression
MHETGIAADLLHKIADIAATYGGGQVVRVQVTLGALTGLSPDHLRAHFAQAAAGTLAAGARLDFTVLRDPADPLAQSIRLDSVELQEEESDEP